MSQESVGGVTGQIDRKYNYREPVSPDGPLQKSDCSKGAKGTDDEHEQDCHGADAEEVLMCLGIEAPKSLEKSAGKQER